MSSTNRRRVVVTGQGLVSPIGRSSTAAWERWARGETAIAPIAKIDARTLPVRIGGEVPDFNPRKEVRNRKLLKLMTVGEDFGFRAAHDAVEQAGVEAAIESGTLDPYRCGLSIGSHKEGFRHSNLHDAFRASVKEDGSIDPERFVADGWSKIPPQIIIEALANIGLYYIAHEFKLRGANYNLLSIGIAGLQSLGEAMHAIAEDEADVMVTGSFDTWINWMCIGHNVFTHTLSQSDAAPQTVYRPFDVARSGAIPGEGAVMFVLEELEHARRRGVAILGEINGAASTHGVPEADEAAAAEALAHCIQSALRSAGCDSDAIDLIHLHGDGTVAGDRIEASGLRQALGARAQSIPATTVKSSMGLMGVAAGTMEAAMALESLRRGSVPAIINLTHPEPDLGLNLVQQSCEDASMSRALVIQRCWPSLCSAMVVSRGPAE